MQCITCKKEYNFSNRELDFYTRTELPQSPQCHDCRLLWRLQWRNERTLYQDKCHLCGKSMLSIYNPEGKYKVLCHDCWHSDKWSGLEYGRDFDFNKTFNENFSQLMHDTPVHATYLNEWKACINSDYANLAGRLKNCYLVFNGTRLEEVYYSRGLVDSQDCTDCYFCHSLEIGYQDVNVNESYKVFYSQDCLGCHDCWFCHSCTSCTDCFGCVNLVNAKYYWFNQQLTKDEYFDKLEEFDFSYQGVEKMKGDFEKHIKKHPRRENASRNATNSIGNYLVYCKGCEFVFEAQGAEDSFHCYSIKNGKDCYGALGFAMDAELMYETVGCGQGYNISFSFGVSSSEDVMYCFEMKKAKKAFGCSSIYGGAEYCIFNKKYSPFEYKKLKSKIIQHMKKTGEWGLYFNPQITPFSQNETIAKEFFPLAKDKALSLGLKWNDNLPGTFGAETLKPENLPDLIKDVKDDIINQVLACTKCSKNYKIIPQELKFYQKYGLPLPKKCFECRHQDRIKRRGPWKPYERKCDKTGKEILAYLEPEYDGLVYSEQAYREEVY